MQRVETVVVGGGLSGCVTAVHLARRGREVLVLERGQHPREKVCGEGLMPHGVECLDELGVLAQVRQTGAVPFVGIGYHSGEVMAHGRFPERPSGLVGLGVRRSRLDAVLHGLARDTKGVEVRSGVRVLGLERRDDGVVVKTDGEPVHARVVVGADGLNSLVRREAGLRGAKASHPRFGARIHYRLAPGRTSGDLVHVYLRPDREYYVTPTGDGELNIAVLCDRRLTKQLGGRLHDGLREQVEDDADLAPWLDGADPVTVASLCGPLRQRVRSASTDRVVLVGDAAGFVDAITGEGMSLAMMGAALAAEELDAALAEGDLSARRLRAYHRRKQRQGRDLVWMTRVMLWGMRDRRLAAWVVGNLARHPATFDRILEIQSHHRGLWPPDLRGLVRLLIGL